jgi:hypothetical protein
MKHDGKYGFCLFLATCILIGSSAAFTQVELSDCADSGCGTPTEEECTEACSGVGNCPVGTYSWSAPEFQRCVAEGSATVNMGSWSLETEDISTDLNNCGSATGDCEAISADISLGEDKNDTASSSWSNTLTAGAKRQATVPFVGKAEVSVQNAFKYGQQDSSSVGQDTKFTGSLRGVPCCGWKQMHLGLWKREEPGSGTVDLKLQGQCAVGGTLCNGGVWETMKTCQATVTFSNVDNWERSTVKTCDKTCPDNELHQDCCVDGVKKSATKTGPCPIPLPQ